jgi:hypothetical protein
LNNVRAAAPLMQIQPPWVRPRLLGEDFAPRRALYLTHIPALLMLTGLIVWIAGDEIAMVFGAAVASVVALYMLWDWLLREGPTRVSTVMAMTFLLGYGGGAVNTWLTVPRGDLTLSSYLGVDAGVLARGMAAVLLSSAVLCFIGELYERPLLGREFRIPLDQSAYTLILLGTGTIVAGYLTHTLGYGGIENTFGEQQGVATALLSWLLPPLLALAAAVFLTGPRGFAKLLMGVCTLVLCVLTMTVRRRQVLYSAMEMLFALRLTGYRMKGTFVRKILLVAAMAFFVLVGISVLMLLRLAAANNRAGANTPLGDRLQVILTWVEEGTAFKRANEANANNVTQRTFVLHFFADVLEGSSQNTPFFGRDAAGFISLAVPRLINPGKDLNFSEEQLVDENFGLTYRDGPNSYLTNGAADFGLLGVLIYPLLLAWFMRLVVDFLTRFLTPLPAAIIVLGALFMLLQTETVITSYLDTIRNLIIFTVILYLFSRLPVIRLSR